MNFSPAQVAEMLGIPTSTLRVYASKFANHLSDQGMRKHRLYTQADVVVFQQIRELAADNIPFSKIDSKLSVVKDTITDLQVKETSNALALIPEVTQKIEEARIMAQSALSQISSLSQTIEDQEKIINQLMEANDYQRAQILYDRKEISELTKYKSKLSFLDNANSQLEKIISRIERLENSWLFRIFK